MVKVDDKLWRGPRPKSFAELQALGFTRVVSLQSGFEDDWTESVYEYESAEDFGILFFDWHWSNFYPPTKRQIKDFLFLFKYSDGHKTYVHCHSGVDRTGAACMAYRIKVMGWPFHAAYQEFVERGRHKWFFFWKPFLKKAME